MPPRFPTLPINQSAYLREIKSEDAARYFRYITDPKVKPFVPANCLPGNQDLASRDLQFLIQLYQYNRGVYWAIANQKDHTLMGTCGFETWHKTHGRLELVYDLDPQFWGNNIMHEALKQIIGFAFACMPVNRIEAVTIPTNEPSRRVLQKLHFTQEGTLRSYRYFKHNYTDVYMFSLLRSEWPYSLDKFLPLKEHTRYFHGS